MAVSHVKSNPVADMTGTVTVFNSAGITTTAAATDLVRPVDWNSVHNQFMTIGGNTAGASTLSGTNIEFHASGAATLSANGQTLVFSAPAQTVQTQGSVQVQGSTGAISFGNGNGITFGGNASTITASHNGLTTAAQSDHSHGNPTLALTNLSGTTASNSNGLTLSLSAAAPGGGGDGGVGLSAGANSVSTGTVVFSNSNGVSFGLNGSTVTAAHNGLTQQSTQPVAVSGQNGSYAFSTLSFSNANGISFGTSAGNAITASHNALTTAALSNHSHGFSASGGSSAFQTLNFANSNGITFSNSNGSVIASHNGLTTARASTDAIGLNTAQTNVTWTVNSSGLSLNAAGYAGTATTFAGANISASMTLNSNGLNLSASVAAPGAAAEQNAINLLGANTAGNTTATGSTIGLSGINMTLSGTNASQIVMSVPATSSLVGVSGVNISTNGSTISIYQNPGSFYANGQYIQGTTTQTVGQSTSIVFPFDLKEPENPAFMRMPHTISVASTSFASTANTTYSYNQQETHNLVLYTRGTGASSQSLISVFSTSASVRMSINVQRNSTNNISVTHALTFPQSGGTSSLSFSYAATNSTDQISTTHMTVLSGMKMWDTQFSTFLDGKIYWLAYGMSTTQTTQGTAALSAARLLHSQMGLSQPNNTIGEFGVANAASNQWVPGLGSFSTAGGGTTSGFPISAVSSSSSHVLPYIQLQRIA